MSEEKTEIETFFGRCRCCLSYGYLKNMWIEHRFEGDAEIYGEMLVQCFALTWEHTEDSMEQDQICEQCICRLRDANDFKRVVLDSQEELIQQIDAENDLTIKEEQLDQDFLDDYKHAVSEDTADTMYADTEFIIDTADAASVKDETQYEEVEYLEDEDFGGTNDAAIDTDSSHITDQSKPVKRQKQPCQQTPDDDDEDTPKRKWPKKLPKSERYKTYKQYSEVDLRKCLEEVRNNVLTASEASLKYDIPKKTICGKIKVDPNNVLIDNTTKSKLERSKKKPRKKPTIFKTKVSFLDGKTKKLIELNKLKAKSLKNEVVATQDDEINKETNVITIEINMGTKIEEMEEPVNADQVRTRYKAIVNNKFKKENREPEKFEVNEMNKHKDNIRTILQNSTATVIKGFWGTGYSCNFCDEQREIPSELKQHNLETHSNVGDDAIKVKYVSDLVIRLDITDLKCKLCNASINSLEDFTTHLTKIHKKLIHTDIKNHIIPFKFDTANLQCAICKKEYKYFKLLSEHMSEHYRNYECSVCERAFINKQSMQTHSYRHNKGVFKCTHCPKVFDSRPKRSVHERVVHALANKTRKCSFCSERFATKDLVQSHEVKAHGVKPTVFSCQACNKSYHSQSSLTTHRKRYHLMLRPHKCSYCDMAFFSKIELRSHTVTHTKSRDFKCDMCTKSFGTRCSLNQHVRGHLDDRRFKCDDCDRTFVHRTAWKVHMRSKHSRIV